MEPVVRALDVGFGHTLPRMTTNPLAERTDKGFI